MRPLRHLRGSQSVVLVGVLGRLCVSCVCVCVPQIRALYQSYYYGRQDQYWADTAMEKLPPLMDASSMMVCGEDLGMIPACVKGVLEGLVIMGLKIQRMPAPGEADGKFGHPDR